MNTTQTAPHIIKVEDHEGFGVCGHCERSGLRWIVTLSDGRTAGSECIKRLAGIKAPTAAKLSWVTGMTVVATHTEGDDTWTLWRRADGGAGTVTARNGLAQGMGGQNAVWTQRGWL